MAHGERKDRRGLGGRARVRLGVALLLGYALLTVGPILQAQLWLRRAPDPEAAWRPRVGALRESLPRRGPVGFVGDRMPDLRQPATTARFFQVQYELAPLVLEAGTGPELVVGVFDEPEAGRQAASQLGLLVLRDFGGGLFLLGRSRLR